MRYPINKFLSDQIEPEAEAKAKAYVVTRHNEFHIGNERIDPLSRYIEKYCAVLVYIGPTGVNAKGVTRPLCFFFGIFQRVFYLSYTHPTFRNVPANMAHCQCIPLKIAIHFGSFNEK